MRQAIPLIALAAVFVALAVILVGVIVAALFGIYSLLTLPGSHLRSGRAQVPPGRGRLTGRPPRRHSHAAGTATPGPGALWPGPAPGQGRQPPAVHPLCAPAL